MLKFNNIWNWRKRTICSTRIELFLSSLLKCINKNGRFQYKWSSTMYTNLLSQCFLYFITPILIQACECFCSLQLSDISQNVCGKHHVQCANLSADCVYTDSWQPPWAHLCGNYWKLLNIATMFRVEMKQMLRLLPRGTVDLLAFIKWIRFSEWTTPTFEPPCIVFMYLDKALNLDAFFQQSDLYLRHICSQ